MSAASPSVSAELAREPIDEILDELRDRLRAATRSGDQRLVEMGQRIEDLKLQLDETQQLLIAAEHQASRLTNLYVAAYQLHASLDPEDVRSAVAEIAVNFLGASECVLLLCLDGSVAPEVVGTMAEATAGAPFEGPRYQRGGDALVDACLTDGQVRFGPVPGSNALAVVPLNAQGSTLGALVLLALLPHKAGLHREDRELLDLLGAHAASALLAAHVFSETQRKLRTLEGLVALVRGGR